jgi:hypothetical protein
MTHFPPIFPDLGMLSTQGFGVTVNGKQSRNFEGARGTRVVDATYGIELLAPGSSQIELHA